MGKFDGVLFATDFDNTFYSKKAAVFPGNYDAIEHFKKEGGRFTVASGRTRVTLEPFLSLLPVNAPVILTNGSQLWDTVTGEMPESVPLPDRAAEDIGQMMEQYPALCCEVFCDGKLYVQNPNDLATRHIADARLTYTEKKAAEVPVPWEKVVFYEDHRLLQTVQADFLSRLGEVYEVIHSNPNMLEVCRKGCSKGKMVLHLADRLGIKKDHIYCIGDEQNDLSMLKISKIGFAPANSESSVLASGVHVVPICEEGAVASALAYLDTIY